MGTPRAFPLMSHSAKSRAPMACCFSRPGGKNHAMYSSCQMASILNGSLPMREPAHCSNVSLEPPSPMPVMPASVSTVTSMLLRLKVRLRSGGLQIRTRVILVFGRAASAARVKATQAAGATASDFRNDLRFMGESFRGDELGIPDSGYSARCASEGRPKGLLNSPLWNRPHLPPEYRRRRVARRAPPAAFQRFPGLAAWPSCGSGCPCSASGAKSDRQSACSSHPPPRSLKTVKEMLPNGVQNEILCLDPPAGNHRIPTWPDTKRRTIRAPWIGPDAGAGREGYCPNPRVVSALGACIVRRAINPRKISVPIPIVCRLYGDSFGGWLEGGPGAVST